MKKLFTFALALMVVVGSYAQVQKVSSKDAKMKVAQEITLSGEELYQNVGSLPNMTRTDAELDFTTYDWQTNTAGKNWTMTFPDGCVGMAYVIATDQDYTDRGTNIAIYYPQDDAWKTSEGLIEDHKTGFGCAARYGQNGIVVVSRNPSSSTCEVYIIEDKDNLPHGDLAPIYVMDGEHNPHFPAVMCTGPNHDHIHILVTGLNETTADGQVNPYYYIRSLDGGQTWSDFMTIDYLGRNYCPQYGSGQDAYFMENTGGDRLDIVVNTRRGDGVVLTSLDEGDTWTRTEYYHHPGIDVDFGESMYMYPRWTSALWDNSGVLHLAYEFGGGTGDATSTSYYPGIGGVVYWNSEMPYHGESIPQYGCDPNNPKPMSPGEPFIIDSAYINQDIYASWWLWSDATHPMWSEYIGYLTPLDETEQPLVDPYEAASWNIELDGIGDAHGHYNGGVCEMPVLVKTPNDDLFVAVWIAMDEHHTTSAGMHYFKVFTRASMDHGLTWTPMKHLTSDFMFEMSECVYPQAAITGNTLVVACQMDGEPHSYTVNNGDTEAYDNYYQAFSFDLEELFGFDAVEEQVSSNTKMNLYPNPAVDQLNITLNQNTDIVIYNIMGQNVMTVEGHAGANTINISNLMSGVYFVNAGTETQKFIVK